MSRKVFISFLGYTNYQECFYVRKSDNFKSSSVRYIQEATIEYLMSRSEWTDQDVAYILLTKGAEKHNWQDNGHKDPKTEKIIEQTGLKTQLQNMHLPFPVIPVKELPDGNNEDEIWQIFTRVFELFQDGDEVYFDLTHGFRYLPMLVLVLGNYAKFLRNITIKSITYGNFESRDKEAKEAPIIDLQSLSDLQDWTSASASFVTNGSVAQLTSMCKKDLTPLIKASKGKDENARILQKYMEALEKVVDDLNTCRGVSIIESDNIKRVNNLSNLLNEIIIEPMKPIMEKLKGSFSEFTISENIKNGYIAAKWCYDNKMYQQSLTILQEMLFSHVCIAMQWDYHNLEIRDGIVSKAFKFAADKMPKESWICKEENIPDIERAMANPTLKLLIQIYNRTTEIRNDFNHSGFKKDPKSPKVIIKGLKGSLDLVQELIHNSEKCS